MKFLRAMPLILTVVRVALGPVFLILDRNRTGAEWLLLIVWVAMATDWLDGKLARRWNAVTTAGKLLDPFADALFCMIVFFVFAEPRTAQGSSGYIFRVPVWGLAVLIAREALVTLVVRPLAWAYGVVVAASGTGKAKTALQYVLMSLVLVPWVAGHEHVAWYALAMAAFFLVLGLSLASGLKYAVTVAGVVARTKRDRRKEAQETQD